MRALVTGATGFIGSRLALHLLESDHAVRVLGQQNNAAEAENARMLGDRGAQVVIGSVTDKDSVFRAHEGIDVVFHLAAAQHEANVPDSHFWEVNVEGTRNMTDAAMAAGVRRLVHGSTIGVYGWSPIRTVSDDSPLEPDNIYGVTKLAGEDVVRSRQGEIDWVIVRIAEVYGPGDRRLIKLFKGVKHGRFPLLGEGSNLHHLVYIDDLIDGLMLTAEKPEAVGRVFVLAGDKPVSTVDMVETVARRLGKTPPRLRIPLGPLMLAARCMERLLRPLGIQPPLHTRRMNFYRKSFSFTLSEARRSLGYAPKVDLTTGVAHTALWYGEHGLI